MGTDAGRFWDERARENALHYVDNRLDLHESDPDAFWQGGEEALERILAVAGMTIKPSETVLDIGCGVGRMTRALARRAARVIGIDVSGEMIAQARALNGDLENVEWVQGDGESLTGIDDTSVDGCFSHVVFQHIPDPLITLAYVHEMGRVLRPGGWALFQVSSDPAVHLQQPRGLVARLKGVAGIAARREDAAWWGSAVEPAALRTAIADAGMELERLLGEGTQYTTVLARKTTG